MKNKKVKLFLVMSMIGALSASQALPVLAADSTSEDDSSVTSTVKIDDTYVHTSGVIRTAAAAKGNGVLKIDDSVIYAEEDDDTDDEYNALVVPMMKRTPFALGIEGTVRATNILGSAQGLYSDSLMVSSGWGVLSTDSGTSYEKNNRKNAIEATNVTAGIGSVEKAKDGKEYTATKTVNGTKYGYTMEGSGYVAYADSGVHDKIEKSKFYSPDYVQIMASSTSSAYYTDSELTSGRIAVMTQQNSGGTISIKDSTVNAEDTAVQIKSGSANNGYTNVVLDNAKVNLDNVKEGSNNWGGTLVELIESDDAGNPGVTTYKVNDNGDHATYTKSTITASTAALKNQTYTGNIWNNIYNYNQALDVTLDKATLNGTISSSYGYHVNDDGTRMENGTELNCYYGGDYRGQKSDYAKIGALYNVASAQVNNPVNVSLSNGSTWNIQLADKSNGEADACYINDLTVGEGCSIESDKPVTLYVYGKQDIKGKVGGNITIKEAEVEGKDTVDSGKLGTSTFIGSSTEIHVLAQDSEGTPNSSLASVKLENDVASESIQMEITPADGYSVSSVTSENDAIQVTKNSDNTYTIKDPGKKITENTNIIVKLTASSDSGGQMPGGGGQMPGGGGPMPGGGDSQDTNTVDTTEALTPVTSGRVYGDVTISSISYGKNYTATKATADDTINSPSASTNVTSVTLKDRVGRTQTVKASSDSGVLTLAVNGTEENLVKAYQKKTTLKAGTYAIAETAGSQSYSEMAKFGNMGGNTAQYTYRAALTLSNGDILDGETIPQLLSSATYNRTGIKNGTLTSNGAFFNGIIAEASSQDTTFQIKNMKIDYNGDGANDFQGEGAAILACTDVYKADVTGTLKTKLEEKAKELADAKNNLAEAKESADANTKKIADLETQLNAAQNAISKAEKDLAAAQTSAKKAKAAQKSAEAALKKAKKALKKAKKTKVTAAKAQISSVKAGKKKAAVTVRKVKGASGYQVQYTLKKSFKKSSVKTVRTAKTKVVLKNLKSGKKYYIRVRAYKKSGSKTVYGAYSKVKTVKVK